MLMRAARLHEYGKPLVVEEVPTPEPGPGQVVVRIQGSGFCHSDLHVIDGELPILPKMPQILGHENAGVIHTIGEGVEHFAVGDAVAVYGGWGCGVCDFCVTGREQLCSTPAWVGLSNYDGGYAEFMLVPHERYLMKLDKLEPKFAAPLTDAALTPYRAITKAMPFFEADYPVLLIGAGGLGQYGIKLLRLFTGSPIIVVDVAEEKLQIAKEYGATYTIDGRDPEARDQIVKLAGGLGVSAAFDFVGAEPTLSLAMRSTRSGGKVTQVGLAGGAVNFTVFTEVPFEVSFESSLWGTIKQLREVIALAESGMLTPIELDFEPLDRINEVFENLKAGKVGGRVVITP
jgi:propanol-preferring alcohol dehydrogenase